MFSDQNLYSDSNLIEEKARLKKFRVMIFSGIFSYPLWGLFSKYIAPESYDPIWQRLAISLISLILFSRTYWGSDKGKFLPKYYLIIWVYSYHLLFLYWMNADSAYYVAYNLIQFPYMLLALPTFKQAQVYTYTKMVAAILFALFVPYQNINPWFYVLSILTLGHFLLAVFKEHDDVYNSAKKSRELFRLSLMNMHEGVMLLDSKGFITSYNTAAENLLGLTGRPHIGRHFKDTVLNSTIDKAFAGESINNEIINFNLSDKKEIWIQLNVQCLKEDHALDTYLVSFADLTLVKQREAEKTMEQAHMAMNARLASLFAVSGGISHEIKNPLSIIMSALSLMKKKMDAQVFDAEFFNDSFSKINIASKRIVNIIDGLRTLTRISDEFPKVPVKLTQILGDTLQLFKENLKVQDIQLIVEEIPDVEINCRAIQISQVVLNLLKNSMDAIENQNEKWIRFHFEKNESYVLIKIIDNGKPIPDSVKQRLWEPFFTTKDVGKGTGIGLSVSKAIIEEHGGKLYLDETWPNTCFTIALKYQI